MILGEDHEGAAVEAGGAALGALDDGLQRNLRLVREAPHRGPEAEVEEQFEVVRRGLHLLPERLERALAGEVIGERSGELGCRKEAEDAIDLGAVAAEQQDGRIADHMVALDERNPGLRLGVDAHRNHAVGDIRYLFGREDLGIELVAGAAPSGVDIEEQRLARGLGLVKRRLEGAFGPADAGGGGAGGREQEERDGQQQRENGSLRETDWAHGWLGGWWLRRLFSASGGRATLAGRQRRCGWPRRWGRPRPRRS